MPQLSPLMWSVSSFMFFLIVVLCSVFYGSMCRNVKMLSKEGYAVVSKWLW